MNCIDPPGWENSCYLEIDVSSLIWLEPQVSVLSPFFDTEVSQKLGQFLRNHTITSLHPRLAWGATDCEQGGSQISLQCDPLRKSDPFPLYEVHCLGCSRWAAFEYRIQSNPLPPLLISVQGSLRHRLVPNDQYLALRMSPACHSLGWEVGAVCNA